MVLIENIITSHALPEAFNTTGRRPSSKPKAQHAHTHRKLSSPVRNVPTLSQLNYLPVFRNTPCFLKSSAFVSTCQPPAAQTVSLVWLSPWPETNPVIAIHCHASCPFQIITRLKHGSSTQSQTF